MLVYSFDFMHFNLNLSMVPGVLNLTMLAPFTLELRPNSYVNKLITF